LAGLSVAIVEKRRDLARKSLLALAVGFPLGILVTYAITQLERVLAIAPDQLSDTSRPLTDFISHPNAFSFIVAFLAGAAGILSLTSAKSGALIGVLISVTTIPAAANVAVAAAYTDWTGFGGALEQLSVNLVMIVIAGMLMLFLQRRIYESRRRKQLNAPYRRAAGLPLGRTRRGGVAAAAPSKGDAGR
jgi:uncharacterized hydrophobic protein (TIGR00271 family)